jgi:hypothetical protein
MTQAVLVYVVFASNVLLICWFGTQLTEHVRKNGLFFSCYARANVSHVTAIKYLIKNILCFRNVETLPDVKCVTLLLYHFPYIIDALHFLQQ